MSDEEKQNTYREAKILEQLSHPGIIHFREIYKNSAGELCIVMDYADGKYFKFKIDIGGDLANLIKQHKK